MLQIELNGAPSASGFLIVGPAGQPFPGTLTISLNTGADADYVLRATAGTTTGLTVSNSNVHLTAGQPVTVQVQATAASAALNDTTIEVLSGGNTVAKFSLTVISDPVLRFSGRFQCRLATDPDPYDSPWGQNSSFGMYAVEGPDAAHPDEPPLDRIIRFQNPVALRPFAEPVGVKISAIEAQVAGNLATFKIGDSVLGLPVRLGNNTKFESQDGNYAQPGFEPLSNFELNIAEAFSGQSAPAVPRNGSDPPGSTAPYADGLFKLDEVGPWKPADFGYPEASWAAHSVAVAQARKQALQHQPDSTTASNQIRDRRLQEFASDLSAITYCMRLIERYSGIIDRNVAIIADSSAMLAYLKSLPKIAIYCECFNFDADVQCGTTTGTLSS